MTKEEIIKQFKINIHQEKLLDTYIFNLKKHNKHTNLVGSSTLEDPWNRHILDCLQILPTLNDCNCSILDMGTGAGLPGLLLSIMGCQNVTLIDSNNKKIKFLEKIKKEMNLKFKTVLDRVENKENEKYDIITSRALANLSKLFTYSHNFLKKNTVLIFLKGKTVNDEILDATKIWKFEYKKHASLSDRRGNLLVIRNLKRL